MTKISYDLDYKENLSKRQWTNMKLIVFFGHNVIKLEKKKTKGWKLLPIDIDHSYLRITTQTGVA